MCRYENNPGFEIMHTSCSNDMLSRWDFEPPQLLDGWRELES